MKKFFDALKIKLNDDICSYFEDTNVYNIKRNADTLTLKIYIVSKNLIPYKVIESARETISKQLSSQVAIFVKYELTNLYTAKVIFDEIKSDLYDELKQIGGFTASVFSSSFLILREMIH